ncbi:hypothetical protein J5N97_006262 [Dioscorea zingiberensis]|uniref:Pentatricopeptide repeat-containing protein n=1 Tax=Dioscorea zingiberensis TaxID=325984 RepID=A0A9D5D9P7_9LILI|nr:hypothetical protein J5N97_006262 [Dioscorea zingiberensis]
MQRCLTALFRAYTSVPARVCFKSFSSLEAHHLFDEIPQRTPSNPIATIQYRLRSGESLDPTTVALAFKSSRGKTGPQIHKIAICSGLDSFVFVSNSLMNMYSKSGSLDLALKVFDGLPDPDVVSWNTILSGFTSGGDAHALPTFVLQMHQAGILFDAVTFTVALTFTSDLQDLEEFCLQLHSLAFKSGFDSDTFVGNALITSYSRSGRVEEASRVFDEMSMRDSISWNALISGLTQQGDSISGYEAILIFLQMLKEEGVRPDHVASASVISACCQEESLLEVGIQVHGFVVKVGLENHVSVSNVLMTMYYKQGGGIDEAKRVFENMRERNVISWTTMISADTENAISLFSSMRLDGVEPNDVTFIALIHAVASDQHLLREGQMIHGMCFVFGISAELNVSNSLVTMYAKLGSTDDSSKIFRDIDHKEIISWNAMISGYAQSGLCEEALETFSSLLLHSKPNQYTFGSILSAISAVQTVSLTYGQRCHSRIVKSGLNTDEYVSGALIDLYAKRGGIDDSLKVFDETTTAQRSLISWTAIISAHAKHGSYEKVMSLFDAMVNSGVHPDEITFLAVLTACGCKGMVDIGWSVFDSMLDEHMIEPWPEHYACMVDMLGRAGRLVEAEEFVKRMPKGPSVSALQSLLGACRVYGNVEMGERVAKVLMEMEPMESGAYVLMSNMYAEKGEWENVAKIRRGMRNRGVKKEVGFSWVDIKVKDSIHMHKFSSDDKTHPMSEEIYRIADCLGFDMKNQEEDSQPVVYM